MIPPGAEHLGAQLGADPWAPGGPLPATYGPWHPEVVIGADSPGALLLPPAEPTASWVYAPRGVWLDDDLLVVADTGNHRVLLFHRVPAADGEPADVVLGQPDEHTEGPQAGGAGPEAGMNLPTGVLRLPDGRLLVADAWNHRILLWDDLPSADRPADLVLGQATPYDVEPNRGRDPTATSFYWPFGVALVDGRLYVADTGNRRVLVWSDGAPCSPDQPADVVLGQPGFASRGENRDGPVGAASFRWPHTVAGNGGGVVVADAGNHRLLGWHAHPDRDLPADYVLGQPDMATAVEFPYRPQTGTGFRFPYAAVRTPSGLAVADTSNNRVLLWDGEPRDQGAEPRWVLGQPSFAANGENRWEQVGFDTLCWPYGLAACGDRLAVADSGNNRVVVWSRA
ncbi:NHL repeat-containing protein [Nocardioides humi]|uniref:NHL repeat-containing protein n=1 Tax=Nocardioides humi TaxID=449461 RepID=UPI001C644088|nr:NHL repeat-containing protein [Nocardioides humi]